MSHRRFNIGLSHAVLVGTGVYCLVQIKNENLSCPHVSYGLITANNILALFCWKREYSRLHDLLRFTEYCQLLFALPCVNTTIWLQNGYSNTWSWAWVVVPLFPLACYLINADFDMPLADFLILFNLVGLGAVSFIKEIGYGIAATISYGFAHSFIRETAICNYALSFFCYFALKAMGFG